MATDNDDVRSRTELITSLQNEQTKQHIVFDAQGRAQFLFEAVVTAPDGSPCLCTEYVYLTPTGMTVRTRQERVYKWKSAWDTDFVFDPAANYDPDGDGNI